MKKALFLIDTLGCGGAEKVLITYVNNLTKIYDITVMTIYDEGVYKKALSKDIRYECLFKCCNIWLKRIVWRAVRFMPASLLHKIVIKNKYDFEIAFLEGMTTKIISGCKNDSKKICWIHTDLIANPQSSNLIYINSDSENKTYSQFDNIICVSEDVKRILGIKFPSLKNVQVIYNPIDKKNILELSQKKEELSLIKNKFTFCAIGRLEKPKGFERLIDAAKKLKDSGYNFDLWIFGDGSLRKDLKNQIEKYDLSKNIFLPGFCTNVYYWLKQSDVYICSSIAEGYSLSVAESLILGIPVISTPCTGPLELLENGNYGLITEDTTLGLYNGMSKMISSEKLLEQYKNKAVERAPFFELDPILQQIQTILNK